MEVTPLKVCVDHRRGTVSQSARRVTGWHANGRQVYAAFTFKTLHSILTGPVSERGVREESKPAKIRKNKRIQQTD